MFGEICHVGSLSAIAAPRTWESIFLPMLGLRCQVHASACNQHNQQRIRAAIQQCLSSSLPTRLPSTRTPTLAQRSSLIKHVWTLEGDIPSDFCVCPDVKWDIRSVFRSQSEPTIPLANNAQLFVSSATFGCMSLTTISTT
jgi:hypothetical protein